MNSPTGGLSFSDRYSKARPSLAILGNESLLESIWITGIRAKTENPERIDPRRMRTRISESDAGFRLTSPGYFAAMGVPLLAGRDFNERDRYDAEQVVIVSATLARQVFGGQSPLGRRIRCGLDER